MIPFQVGIWVNSSDYRIATPDPLRDFAEKLVNEININNMEDVNRFCNVFVDFKSQVCINSMFVKCYVHVHMLELKTV